MLIDKLLEFGSTVIAEMKRPLQKKLIKRSLEKSFDSIESQKQDAELAIVSLREKLITCKTEEEGKTIFSAIVVQKTIILNCDSTVELLKAEEKELFGE